VRVTLSDWLLLIGVTHGGDGGDPAHNV
jgi:hypothetical protein